MSDYEHAENLRQWQALTSERIPLSDIDDVVYRTSAEEFTAWKNSIDADATNAFYVYLRNTRDSEIADFLCIAKQIDAEWSKTRTPWYYPREKVYENEGGDFATLIERCKALRPCLLRAVTTGASNIAKRLLRTFRPTICSRGCRAVLSQGAGVAWAMCSVPIRFLPSWAIFGR